MASVELAVSAWQAIRALPQEQWDTFFDTFPWGTLVPLSPSHPACTSERQWALPLEILIRDMGAHDPTLMAYWKKRLPDILAHINATWKTQGKYGSVPKVADVYLNTAIVGVYQECLRQANTEWAEALEKHLRNGDHDMMDPRDIIVQRWSAKSKESRAYWQDPTLHWKALLQGMVAHPDRRSDLLEWVKRHTKAKTENMVLGALLALVKDNWGTSDKWSATSKPALFSQQGLSPMSLDAQHDWIAWVTEHSRSWPQGWQHRKAWVNDFLGMAGRLTAVKDADIWERFWTTMLGTTEEAMMLLKQAPTTLTPSHVKNAFQCERHAGYFGRVMMAAMREPAEPTNETPSFLTRAKMWAMDDCHRWTAAQWAAWEPQQPWIETAMTEAAVAETVWKHTLEAFSLGYNEKYHQHHQFWKKTPAMVQAWQERAWEHHPEKVMHLMLTTKSGIHWDAWETFLTPLLQKADAEHVQRWAAAFQVGKESNLQRSPQEILSIERMVLQGLAQGTRASSPKMRL